LTNVIDVSKWNLNDTQKWILGLLVPVVLSVGGTLLAIFIKTDEESIYKKLESKSSKDKA
jgi:hypothetical protein